METHRRQPVDRTAAHEARLYFKLQIAAASLRTTADRACLSEAGITAAQAAVLVVLSQHPGATQRSLSAVLCQRESATTAMINRLDSAGLIERQPNPGDGRSWRLHLTAPGEVALVGAARAFATLNARFDDALQSGGVTSLSDGLERLAAVTLAKDR